jgi:Protein of unknown function (DUF1433).
MRHEELTTQEAEKKAFIEKQEKLITKYFKYNIPSYKSITFTGNERVPTGDFFIDSYLNNNKQLYFSAQISNGSGQHNFEGDLTHSNELFNLYRKDMKSLPQIEDLEKKHEEKSESKLFIKVASGEDSAF